MRSGTDTLRDERSVADRGPRPHADRQRVARDRGLDAVHEVVVGAEGRGGLGRADLDLRLERPADLDAGEAAGDVDLARHDVAGATERAGTGYAAGRPERDQAGEDDDDQRTGHAHAAEHSHAASPARYRRNSGTRHARTRRARDAVPGRRRRPRPSG